MTDDARVRDGASTANTASTAGAPQGGIRWKTAAKMVALGVAAMIVLGAAVVPYGRFILQAVYGILGQAVLAPFGPALPGAVSDVLTNGAVLAIGLWAGGRVGTILTHQAVGGRLGSERLLTTAVCLAGAAGAAAFAGAALSVNMG